MDVQRDLERHAVIDDKGFVGDHRQDPSHVPLLWMVVQDMRCSPFHRAQASAKEYAKESWGGFIFIRGGQGIRR